MCMRVYTKIHICAVVSVFVYACVCVVSILGDNNKLQISVQIKFVSKKTTRRNKKTLENQLEVLRQHLCLCIFLCVCVSLLILYFYTYFVFVVLFPLSSLFSFSVCNTWPWSQHLVPAARTHPANAPSTLVAASRVAAAILSRRCAASATTTACSRAMATLH